MDNNNIIELLKTICCRGYYDFCGAPTLELMYRLYGLEKLKSFCELNAFKYRMRAGKKQDLEEDIKKAMFYEDVYNLLNNKDGNNDSR